MVNTQKKMIHRSISQSPEKWKKAGPSHHPVVYGELFSGPQQTQLLKNDLRRHQLRPMTKRVTKKMGQGWKDQEISHGRPNQYHLK